MRQAPLTDDERSTYEWQMWVDGFGERGQQALKGASVLVSRIGGLGGIVAYQLAAAGIGKLVLAHAGHPNTPRALELMAEFDNLYADLTPVWDHAVQVSPEHLSAFAGRFLFGSDAPNNPAGPSEQAERFGTLGLDEDALALLLGGAADRLIRLDSINRR